MYVRRYGGHYCIGCEDFLSKEALKAGHCPDHETPPEWIEEENLFFRLSRYQNEIEELIQSDRISITPSYRKKEILNFIEKKRLKVPCDLLRSFLPFEDGDAEIENYRFDDGLKELWREVDRINGEIASDKPWETLKANP